MTALALRLREIVQSRKQGLLAISESRASEKRYPDKWSIKEILGHLTDSAANNHQRFVRMQEVENIGVFQYTQKFWVTAQDYQAEPWIDLVDFWYRYNLHLAHVIAHVNPVALDHLCDMGYAQPAKLSFVMEDYIRHVEHHLKQILETANPMEREKWVRRDPTSAAREHET